ncbi:hypothetical protein P9112_002215 [Eukaryota sp. TZLM1-RC]
MLLQVSKFSTAGLPFGSSSLASLLRVRLTIVQTTSKPLPKTLVSPILSKSAMYKSSNFSWDDSLPLGVSPSSIVTPDVALLFELVSPTTSIPRSITVDFPSFKGWTVFAWGFFLLHDPLANINSICNNPISLQLFAPPFNTKTSVEEWFQFKKSVLLKYCLINSKFVFEFDTYSQPEHLPSLCTLSLTEPTATNQSLTSSRVKKSVFSEKLLYLLRKFSCRTSIHWSRPSEFKHYPLYLPLNSQRVVNSLFSKCGRFLIIALNGSLINPIVILESATFNQLCELPGHLSTITDLAYTCASTNGRRRFFVLSLSLEGEVSLWKIKEVDGRLSYDRFNIHVDGGPIKATFLQNGDCPSFLIGCVGKDGIISVLKFDGRTLSNFFKYNPELLINHQSITSTSSTIVASDDKGRLFVYTISSDKLVLDSYIQLNDTNHFVIDHVISQESSNLILAVASSSGAAFLVDIIHAFVVQRIDIPTMTVPCLSPDSSQLYLVSQGYLQAVEVHSGEKLKLLNFNVPQSRHQSFLIGHHPLWHSISVIDLFDNSLAIFVGTEIEFNT